MRSLQRLLLSFSFVFALLIGALGPTVAAPKPVDLDVILPLTGAGAFLGKTHKNALLALQTAINARGGIQGRPLNFVFYDDQTNPQQTVALANQILAHHPQIVLGSSLSAMCKAIAPLFTNGPVLYCLSPAFYPAKGAYEFAANVSTKDLIFAFFRYFREKGLTRIGRITTTDASGQDADEDVKLALALPENKGMSVVSDEHYNVSDTSVTAQASRLKSANPQAVIVWAAGTPLGTALRAMNDVGLDVPTATTSANMVAPQIASYSAFLPREFYFTGAGFIANIAQSPDMRKAETFFYNAMRDANINVDFQTGMAYDPAWIVVNMLKKIGPDATALQMRDYLNNLKGFAGTSGVYDFTTGNQHGIDLKDILVMRWDPTRNTWYTVSQFGGAPLK